MSKVLPRLFASLLVPKDLDWCFFSWICGRHPHFTSQSEFKVNVEAEPGLNRTRLGFTELGPDLDSDLDLNT